MDVTPGTVIASRYRVLKELGRGGMGVVYLVEHVHTGEQLALKALLAHVGAQAELVERFRREARTPSRIRSEHVVKVTDADTAPELGGAPFMVMERLEGRDLDERLSQDGPLSPRELLAILTPVTEVLDQAHALGIVHRDLKPENLFLHHRTDGTMVVKVVDFGIAKLVEGPEGPDPRLTGTGAVMGTPVYMAPEQARGDIAAIGPATDIWAIGQIAFHALTGQLYWRGPSLGEVMAQILTSTIEPPSSRAPHLPPGFDGWFARSCAKEPRERWPSASAQLQGLREALAETATSGTAGTAATVAASPAAAACAFPTPADTTSPAAGPSRAAKTVAAPPAAHAALASSPASPSSSRRSLWVGGVAILAAGLAGAAAITLADGEPERPSAASAAPSAPPPPSTATASPETATRGEPKVMSALNGGAPGYYEPKQLLDLVEPHLTEIRACYRDELEAQPDLKGTVFLTIMLGADHRPMTATCVAEMKGGTPRALCPCLRGKAKAWSFPEPLKPLPMISVGYKFICTPDG